MLTFAVCLIAQVTNCYGVIVLIVRRLNFSSRLDCGVSVQIQQKSLRFVIANDFFREERVIDEAQNICNKRKQENNKCRDFSKENPSSIFSFPDIKNINVKNREEAQIDCCPLD